jgi:Skp family chaperone for outer membrane proteins
MKNRLQIVLLAALLMAACAGASAADLKIATVDMKKAFDTYYKTRAATTAMTNEVAEMQKALTAMANEAKKTRDDAQQAYERANDQSVSADERDKSKRLAQQKGMEYQDMETKIDQYNKSEQTRLGEKRSMRIETILGEITGVLKDLAKSGGYNFVFDKTGDSASGIPVVLYTSGVDDLTDELIKQLNATAPVEPSGEVRPPAAAPVVK